MPDLGPTLERKGNYTSRSFILLFIESTSAIFKRELRSSQGSGLVPSNSDTMIASFFSFFVAMRGLER